jgi:hypothetical protein
MGVSDSNEEMKQYGVGVYLYLEFLKRLLVAFILMSAVLAVQIVNNYEGDGLSSYK